MDVPINNLLEALKRIRDNGPAKPNLGLCANVSKLTNGRTFELKALFEAWPEFSGCSTYPVPAVGFPEGFSCAWDAYNRTEGSMYEGEYGAARMRLLNFMIDELEKRYSV